jgi:hypothetical protein
MSNFLVLYMAATIYRAVTHTGLGNAEPVVGGLLFVAVVLDFVRFSRWVDADAPQSAEVASKASSTTGRDSHRDREV